MSDNAVDGIDTAVPPSGTGCADCEAADPPGWWVHLRRCAACGHIGCCDTSPEQHATRHSELSGHAVIRSFEPGEDWFYDYETGQPFDGPVLAPPYCRPEEETAPGPYGRVPPDWMEHIHR